jgi:hypothetical protein
MLTFTTSALLAFVSLLPTFFIQDDPASVKQLAGPSKKEWVYEPFKEFIGIGGGCAGGESWVFHKDGKVEIKKCEGQRIVITEKHWTLRRKSPLDVALTVDGTEYLVLFPRTPKQKEKMILRIKSDAKTGATKDLAFIREAQ